MKNTDEEIVYLACPYSHPDQEVREKRFRGANRAAGRLMKRGENVFSPISHTHPISICCDLPGDWVFWKKFDLAFISVSSKLYVLMLDGWKESRGIQAEIKVAERLGIKIEYLPAGFVCG